MNESNTPATLEEALSHIASLESKLTEAKTEAATYFRWWNEATSANKNYIVALKAILTILNDKEK